MTDARSSGFVLPVVLGAIALIAVSLWTLARVEGMRVARAAERREAVFADVGAATVEARIAYRLLTEPLGVRSIGAPQQDDRGPAPIILDARPYRMELNPEASAIIRLQDEAGLVNLNSLDGVAVARLLIVTGLEPRNSERLAALLADFIDGDDLLRTDGAESTDYARAGLAPPPNHPIADPREVFRVMGWTRAMTPAQMHVLRDNATALSPGAFFNPNTATPRALQANFGIDAKSADKVILQRENLSLLSREDVMALTGAAPGDSYVRALPSRSMLVSVMIVAGPSEESYVYASRLRIAEEGAEKPFASTRTNAPVRAHQREWAGADVVGELDTLPGTIRRRAP